MKKLTLLLLLVSYTFSFAQENYKYIIVPKKFDFFKEENNYNLNLMTKSFFEKEGYQVFYDTDNFPEELAKNRCLALFVNAIENNTLFITKINIEIKDCFNKVVYKSEQGTSREKDLKTAYTLSFRTALSSMSNTLNFKPVQVGNNEITSKPLEIQSPAEIVLPIAEDTKKGTLHTIQLFAIPIENGYKLVTDKPETIFILKKTTADSVFMAQKDSKSGVLLKKSNSYFFEYYEREKLLSEKVEVKF